VGAVMASGTRHHRVDGHLRRLAFTPSTVATGTSTAADSMRAPSSPPFVEDEVRRCHRRPVRDAPRLSPPSTWARRSPPPPPPHARRFEAVAVLCPGRLALVARQFPDGYQNPATAVARLTLPDLGGILTMWVRDCNWRLPTGLRNYPAGSGAS
jgi:hypothetical protein